jgi:hypothetical protein
MTYFQLSGSAISFTTTNHAEVVKALRKPLKTARNVFFFYRRQKWAIILNGVTKITQ